MEQSYDYEKLILDMSITDEFKCFTSPYSTETETLQQMENYRKQQEEAKQLAKRRDNKVFLKLFENVLTNPFFNGTMSIEEEIDEEDSKTNPFLD